MRWLAELKRRRVFHTAVLYSAVAWVLLQVADLLLGMFEVPPWGLRLVFALLVVGFPIALVLSWMHQLTAQGLKRESDPPEFLPAALEPAARPATDHSIAVLPFANMSEEPANAYFADGLSEELMGLLTRIPGLRVIARTSSFAFRSSTLSAAAIAQELKVAHLLEGSVRKAGTRIRITAQLVRAVDNSRIWSQSFDRDLTDIFSVQDEIAAAVASELRIRLLGTEAPRTRTTDPRAYALYLRSRYAFELASVSGYEQAREALEAALAIDPEFGPAWATLGALYWSMANNSVVGYQEGSRKARTATEKAVDLDPEHAEAMSMLGFLDVVEATDVAGGTRRIERSLRIEPHNQRLLTRAATIALRRGRIDEAMRHAEQALQSDPLSPHAHAVFGNACLYAGRLEQAEALRRRVLVLSPGWLSGHYNLGRVLLARGDRAAALEQMQLEQSEFWRLTGLAITHHALCQEAESTAALRGLLAMDHAGIAYQVAEIHAYRGKVDDAFEWLERAAGIHDSGLSYACVDPLLGTLHADVRWGRFLAQHGLGV